MINKKQLRVIFFGHDEVAIKVLDVIRTFGKLTAIVVPLNRPDIQVKPLIEYAKRNKIKIFKPKNINGRGFIRKLSELSPNLAIVYNYSYIFKKKIINIFPLGMVNIHGALLPQYRGANVINWVLINGENKTGITIHYINEQIDNGTIIAQETFPISSSDDARSLKKKLAKKSPELLKKVLKTIEFGKIRSYKKSNSDKKGNYYHRRSPEDGKIDFNKSNTEIVNLARALVSPWPGAFAYHKEKKIIFEKVKKALALKETFQPGEIVSVQKNGLIIATGKGMIRLTGIRENNNVKAPKGFKKGARFM